MKRTVYLPIFLVSLAVLAAFGCGPPGQSVTGRVDALFTEWDKPDSPGCALAVVKDGEIVYKRGYGMANLEHDIPVTPETVFYIGSESKQFVTMCILLLEEEGKLSVDDDIRKYVPEIPDYGSSITIHHLILHTSGLRDYFILWALSGIDFANFNTESETLALIKRQRELNFPPGDERLYCNSGYLLLAVIIERVSGKPLSEFARERIFEPLGMANSHFHDNPMRIVKNRAYGYVPREDDGWNLQTLRFALVGSGGLYTNVEDIYLWNENFYDNRLGTGGQKLIEKMHTTGRLNSGEVLSYAYALTIGEYRGLKTVRHGGALGGYRSHVLRFPDERFTVILLFNLSDVNPGAYAEKVADIYLADRLQPDAPEQKSEAAEETADSAAGEEQPPAAGPDGDYIGMYYSDELDVKYRIFVEDGSLAVRIRDTVTFPMKPLEKDAYDAGIAVMRFRRDTRGGVIGFGLEAGRVKNLAFERM